MIFFSDALKVSGVFIREVSEVLFVSFVLFEKLFFDFLFFFLNFNVLRVLASLFLNFMLLTVNFISF